MKKFLFILLAFPLSLFSSEKLEEVLSQLPCSWNIHLYPGKESDEILLCMHGMGGNHRCGERLRPISAIKATILSFDFPDANILGVSFDPDTVSFGTFRELVVPLQIMRSLVVEAGIAKLSLYGFSAGGGALINTLVALNQNDPKLMEIGISNEDRRKIIEAIEKGVILLDAPLKSVEEIMELRGYSVQLQVIGSRYLTNGYNPIGALKKLKGLTLTAFVFFQNPDEIIYNRDDEIYIKNLEEANPMGLTCAIIADDGGHSAPHPSLWKAYEHFQKSGTCIPNTHP